MIMIVLSALFAVSWAIVGAYHLSQPTIPHVSYACVWVLIVAFYIAQTVCYVREYAKKHKNSI